MGRLRGVGLVRRPRWGVLAGVGPNLAGAKPHCRTARRAGLAPAVPVGDLGDRPPTSLSPATKGVTDRDYGESLYVLGDAQDLANRALVSEVNSRQGRPQAEGPRGEHQVLDRGKDAGCGA